MHEEFVSRQQIESLQAERFALVWPHIAATPLYERKLREAGIQAADIKSLADLPKIPFTYKEEVRSTGVFQRTPLSTSDIYAIYSSDGTSGERTLYAWSEEDVRVQSQVARRILTGVGLGPGDLGLVIAPLSLPVMGHCMIRQYKAVGAGFVPLGATSPEDVLKYLTELPITAVATLPIVASRLLEYIKFVARQVIDGGIRIRQFHMGGDYFSAALRARLEQQWRADCYDFYGLSEVFGPVCGECVCKNGMHFAADFVLAEVLHPRTAMPVDEGTPGVAVYTTLWKKGFPLLRYWTNDYVTWDWHPCACGQTLPRMRFLGRTADFAEIPSGRVFAKQVEEWILRFPVAAEYYCEYIPDDRPRVDVHVEPIPDEAFCQGELSEELSGVFGMESRIVVHAPGSLPRSLSKPKRLVGFGRESLK